MPRRRPQLSKKYYRDFARYIETMHAVHAGLALDAAAEPSRLSPARLLIEIAEMQVELHALQSLLIDKGICSLEEVVAAKVKQAEGTKRFKEGTHNVKLVCAYGHPVTPDDD